MVMGLIMVALSAVQAPRSSPCPPEALVTLRRFLDYDMAGFRLGSDGHGEIWELTTKSGDGPEYPIIVTRDYRIASTRAAVEGCQIKVQFRTLGLRFEEGQSGATLHLSKRRADAATFMLRYTSGWKVDTTDDRFTFAPHPGKKATLTWLNGLRSMQDTLEDRLRVQAYIGLVKSAG